MVVVGSPLIDFMSGNDQAQKTVLIETAIPELAVEVLDEEFCVGLSGWMNASVSSRLRAQKNIALLVS